LEIDAEGLANVHILRFGKGKAQDRNPRADLRTGGARPERRVPRRGRDAREPGPSDPPLASISSRRRRVWGKDSRARKPRKRRRRASSGLPMARQQSRLARGRKCSRVGGHEASWQVTGRSSTTSQDQMVRHEDPCFPRRGRPHRSRYDRPTRGGIPSVPHRSGRGAHVNCRSYLARTELCRDRAMARVSSGSGGRRSLDNRRQFGRPGRRSDENSASGTRGEPLPGRRMRPGRCVP